MSTSTCPTPTEIADHLRDVFSEEIETHLAMCDPCMAVYERLFEEKYGETVERFQPVGIASLLEADSSVPDRIGVYRISRKIGGGGMGVVYEAIHTELNRLVAIKVIRSADPHLRDRFQREKQIAGRLRHQNIVAATDAGTFRGRPYLVTELLNGRDLQQLVDGDGPLSWERAVGIMEQAADGLAHLHRENVIHRDIKPSNIFLTDEGVVKILDVGMAKLVEDDTTAHTLTGDTLGTCDYIAPEQIRNAKNADRRSDIYSLGCTFYFLLTGAPPYSGEGYMTNGEKFAAHVNPTEIPDIRTVQPEVPAMVAKLLANMVAKSPERRPVDAEVILERLKGLATSPTKKTPSPALSRPLVGGLVAVLLVILGGVFFTIYANGNRPSEPLPTTETRLEQPEPPTIEPAVTATLPTETVVPPLVALPTVIPEKRTETALAKDQPTTPSPEPVKWNPGVQRPSETITPIPSGHFVDDEEEEE